MKDKLIRLSDALQAVRESYIWDSEISQRTLEKKLAALPEAEAREMLTAKNPELSEEDLEKFKQWLTDWTPVLIPRERSGRINLNETIKVKLTETGKEIYWDHYKHTEPRTDEDGYTKFSLWQFMYIYGHFMHLTAPGVIENSEIIYEQED